MSLESARRENAWEEYGFDRFRNWLGKTWFPDGGMLCRARGFRVKAVDLNSHKVDAVNRGVALVYEPGLEDLMHESGGRLHASQNIGEAVIDSEATFVVVGTPSEESGDFRCNMLC